MAGMIGVAQIAEEALAASTTETLLQLVAATNHAVKLLAWGVYFDGVSPTEEAIQVELLRQTSAGTGGSGVTIVKWNDSIADSFDTTALEGFTAEPTASDILESKEVHPQTGYEVIYPLGQEPVIGAGDRMGIRVIPPATVNANARAFMRFEE